MSGFPLQLNSRGSGEEADAAVARTATATTLGKARQDSRLIVASRSRFALSIRPTNRPPIRGKPGSTARPPWRLRRPPSVATSEPYPAGRLCVSNDTARLVKCVELREAAHLTAGRPGNRADVPGRRARRRARLPRWCSTLSPQDGGAPDLLEPSPHRGPR
jgi:hypothetical protein